MNLDLQKRWTQHWEGRRAVAYDDATGEPITPATARKGNPTIAVGLNLLTTAAHLGIRSLGLNYQDVASGQLTLTDQQIDHLFAISLNSAIGDAFRLFSGFDQFPEPQQIVIVDLCFNLGGPKLATFHHTCAAIRAHNWADAARYLSDSEWFHQVGTGVHQRGGANAAVLANLITPESVLQGA